jgi:hypothetical protein
MWNAEVDIVEQNQQTEQCELLTDNRKTIEESRGLIETKPKEGKV